MITTEALINGARVLIGTKFQHQGRNAETEGLDCLGLIQGAMSNAGLDLYEHLGIKDNQLYAPIYDRNPHLRLSAEIAKFCIRLMPWPDPPIVGSMILMRLPGARYPHHVALYTESGTIIHAESYRTMQVVENTFGAPWTRCVNSHWKLPGVEYP